MAYFIENVKFSPFKNANRLRVTSGYGNRTITINGKTDSNFHNGLDINNSDQNEICAFADGQVVELVNNRDGYSNTKGNYVIIKHDKGKSIYQHLKCGSVCVKVGDLVKQNQTIAIKGKTGYATGVHLHFGVMIGTKWVDPTPYVTGECLINNIKILLPNPVEKNSNVDQIEVLITNLRCRTQPILDKNNVIGFAKVGYYNIINKLEDELYIWYEIEKDRWIADDKSGTWLKIHKKEEPILPSEEPKKDEDAPTSQNKPSTEPKEEDSTNIPTEPKTEEKQGENKAQEEEYDYGMRQEENNPLLYFFDWLFNLIRKIFKKVSK